MHQQWNTDSETFYEVSQNSPIFLSFLTHNIHPPLRKNGGRTAEERRKSGVSAAPLSELLKIFACGVRIQAVPQNSSKVRFWRFGGTEGQHIPCQWLRFLLGTGQGVSFYGGCSRILKLECREIKSIWGVENDVITYFLEIRVSSNIPLKPFSNS